MNSKLINCKDLLATIMLATLSVSVHAESSTETKSSTQSQPAVKPNVIKLRDTIVGSKEQPRFISIVPWKKLSSPVIEVEHVHKSQLDKLRARTIDSLNKQRQLATHLMGRKPQ
ncbi:hypothetical protein MHM98_00710 [Psychrobium sp. MM17-31]|uniref:hypothetical protein n=1 Tax=Psychrobium sp. MM17-31 TaxID=2917758 RepID=UPI001EF45844|nr:hypothetical protein [Psychrobium sp. MM17-31]MCG7529888.1 hypothetical protein [Psychrobium sp. MM17-31]